MSGKQGRVTRWKCADHVKIYDIVIQDSCIYLKKIVVVLFGHSRGTKSTRKRS